MRHATLLFWLVLSACSGAPKPPPAEVCSGGRETSEDTAGHCCWAGQVWSKLKTRCRGTPDRCPENSAIAGEECLFDGLPAAQLGTQIVPGVGIGALKFGEATPEDVQKIYGRNGAITRNNQTITGIDYGRDALGRAIEKSNPRKPASFDFEGGKLSEIGINCSQQQLRVGKLGINSKRADVQRAFPHCPVETDPDQSLTFHCDEEGATVWVGADGEVFGYRIFAKRDAWKPDDAAPAGSDADTPTHEDGD